MNIKYRVDENLRARTMYVMQDNFPDTYSACSAYGVRTVIREATRNGTATTQSMPWTAVVESMPKSVSLFCRDDESVDFVVVVDAFVFENLDKDAQEDALACALLDLDVMKRDDGSLSLVIVRQDPSIPLHTGALTREDVICAGETSQEPIDRLGLDGFVRDAILEDSRNSANSVNDVIRGILTKSYAETICQRIEKEAAEAKAKIERDTANRLSLLGIKPQARHSGSDSTEVELAVVPYTPAPATVVKKKTFAEEAKFVLQSEVVDPASDGPPDVIDASVYAPFLPKMPSPCAEPVSTGVGHRNDVPVYLRRRDFPWRTRADVFITALNMVTSEGSKSIWRDAFCATEDIFRRYLGKPPIREAHRAKAVFPKFLLSKPNDWDTYVSWLSANGIANVRAFDKTNVFVHGLYRLWSKAKPIVRINCAD